MNSIKEKKVELIELFYDLIYVYAISRLSLLIEGDGHGAFLPSFIIYVIYCLVILQSWLYLTNYVNRYGKWRWYEIVLTSVNMIAALYMSNTIANNEVSPVAFNLSMFIMLLCVLVMYIIECIKNDEDLGAAKNSIVILIVIETFYFLAYILSHYPIGPLPIYVDLIAVLLGAFLPFFLKGNFDPKIISFPHLVERFELLAIVTFGDSIVTISQFFDVSKFSFLPSALFVIILLMFTSYVAQIHYLVEHRQVDRGLRMMFSHYFVVIAINMLTISIKFIIVNNSDHIFIALHSAFAIAMFYIAIYVNSIYYKKEYTFTKSDWALFAASVVLGVIVLMIFIEPIWGLVAGCLVMILPNMVMLIKKL